MIKLICYKIFPSAIISHVAAIDSSDMFVLMDGNWCDACEWLLQKLDFAAHRIRQEDVAMFDQCGKIQQEFLTQYYKFLSDNPCGLHQKGDRFRVPMVFFSEITDIDFDPF